MRQDPRSTGEAGRATGAENSTGNIPCRRSPILDNLKVNEPHKQIIDVFMHLTPQSVGLGQRLIGECNDEVQVAVISTLVIECAVIGGWWSLTCL
ncbi:hypothetical protein DPX16_16640 [Anabarilius grahami]|uniref:Uncharacterized protein n=1 Tax=Anabarilius grahami TaxID=495550 RepID=A0A3N0YS65_ANAGA|nr:hypothetical protein DPX16_16640 [Anabarilius grahami]